MNISDFIHARAEPKPEPTRQERIEYAKQERAYIEKTWKIRARNKSCSQCFDTGYREGFVTDDLISPYSYRTYAVECDCGILKRIEADGHREQVPNRPLDSFKELKPHHTVMLRTARRFLAQDDDKWLFVGGSVGSGKTHLCEVVVKELFEKTQQTTRTIKWRDFAKKVKQDPTNDVALMELKAVPILYIDDFMKAGGDKVTEADINIAYDIIEGRMRLNKWTILSCEYTLDGIRDIDKSVASRLAEMAKNYTLNIKGDDKDVRWG